MGTWGHEGRDVDVWDTGAWGRLGHGDVGMYGMRECEGRVRRDVKYRGRGR